MNFHGERRANATHQSTTDPDSRLTKKGPGKEAKLAYLGEVLMENRHGLVVDACVVAATGTGEREAATDLLQALPIGCATPRRGPNLTIAQHHGRRGTRRHGHGIARAR